MRSLCRLHKTPHWKVTSFSISPSPISTAGLMPSLSSIWQSTCRISRLGTMYWWRESRRYGEVVMVQSILVDESRSGVCHRQFFCFRVRKKHGSCFFRFRVRKKRFRRTDVIFRAICELFVFFFCFFLRLGLASNNGEKTRDIFFHKTPWPWRPSGDNQP